MTTELAPNNPDVKSSLTFKQTDIDVRIVLRDCDESITWRFKTNSPEKIAESIRKAERAMVVLEQLQTYLKSKL
jgi:hypothetical protein